MKIHTIDLGFVNCYLVETGDGFILVDTGVAGRLGVLEKFLLNAGCKPGNLKLIFITHGDIDHTGNCVDLRERYKTRIGMHQADSVMVENGAMTPKRKVKSSLLRVMHRIMRLFGANKKMVVGFKRFKPDLYLEEGQSLQEYGFDATVLHLPGHSGGSIGILVENGDLICGDILESRSGLHPTMIVEDEAQLATSLERLSTLGIKTVYPGHGKPFLWEQFVKRR